MLTILLSTLEIEFLVIIELLQYHRNQVIVPMASVKTEEGKKTVAEIPMKRAATLEELDGCLLLLASNNASSYMTGATVEIDGGWATLT